MTTTEGTVEIANVEMAKAWDGHDGDHWTDYADQYERAGRLTWKQFESANLVRPTDDVLDVGCGSGAGALYAAGVTSGSVLGVDLSSRMLGLARERAAEKGLTNVTFEQGDAQVYPFAPDSFDLALSSYGAMFFNDPVAAFTNIGRGVRAGGRLVLLAWRDLSSNAWLMALRDALAMGRDLPVPPPDAPSPFALADPDRVRVRLAAAGFESAEFTPIDEPMDLGANLEDAFAFVREFGIVEGLSNDLDDTQKAQALDNIRALLAKAETPDGVLLDSGSWLITAVRTA